MVIVNVILLEVCLVDVDISSNYKYCILSYL